MSVLNEKKSCKIQFTAFLGGRERGESQFVGWEQKCDDDERIGIKSSQTQHRLSDCEKQSIFFSRIKLLQIVKRRFWKF